MDLILPLNAENNHRKETDRIFLSLINLVGSMVSNEIALISRLVSADDETGPVNAIL